MLSRGYTAQPQSGFQPTYPQQDSAYRQPAAGYTNPVMPGANYPARQEGYYNAEYGTSNPAVPEMIEAGECDDAEGILEIMSDGYGSSGATTTFPERTMFMFQTPKSAVSASAPAIL